MKSQAQGQFYQIVMAIWLTFSIGGVVLAVVSGRQLSSRQATGRQITGTGDELDLIYRSLLDMETGERGYVITGDKHFLEPYIKAQAKLPGQFDELMTWVHDNPAWVNDAASLQAAAETVMSWQQAVIEARDKSFDKALAIVASGRLKEMMDDIRGRIDSLNRELQNRQTLLQKEIADRVFHANLGTLVAGSFGIGSGLLAIWLARMASRQQEREQNLLQAKLQAERSDREKTAFLANMSHEIRTPMNAILGFSELLGSETLSPKHQQYLQSIRTSANSLLQLINDILDVSKIEAGVMELHREPTDMHEICDLIRVLFAKVAAKKNIRLECQVAADLPRALLLDRTRLRQILANLVGNAVKFTDTGGIDVRVSGEKQSANSHLTLIVEVQDTGVGIPPDKLDIIFKPFAQSGAFSEKDRLGTGLGLSIVKRLTQTMGGTVTVASVLGEGSAFHLRFPDTPISARLAVSEKPSPAQAVNFNDLRPATLLVVDDHPINCELLQGIFSSSHHKLCFCDDSKTAITTARDLKPDLVLMDIHLNDHDTVTGLRKTPGLELVPVIAVTASAFVDTESSAKAGFSGCIRKPFSRQELFNELAAFLPRQAMEAEVEKAVAAPVSQPVARELLTQLRALLRDPWPTIHASMAVNESKAFAQTLVKLGQGFGCQPLVDYAQQILRDAENYAVTDLEKNLGEFSRLVEQLEQAPQK